MLYNIGITPDQTTVYVEFYHGLRLLPQTMVKLCVYHSLGGGYSYSNMTNYFKMNNYCKFYCKTFIVTTAIMSDNREDLVMLYFTGEEFRRLANQNRGHIRVMLE